MHRTHYLWQNYKLVDVPLVGDMGGPSADLERVFAHQLFASSVVLRLDWLTSQTRRLRCRRSRGVHARHVRHRSVFLR